jgi:hypothetical protein
MHPRKPCASTISQYTATSQHAGGVQRATARPRERLDATRIPVCGERGRGRFIFLEFRSFWSHVLTNKHIGHGATHRLAQHASDHWRALTATPETRLACSRWGTSAGATSATGAPSASAAPTSRSTTDTSPPAARSLPPGRGADGAPLGCSPCRAALTRPSVPAAC